MTAVGGGGEKCLSRFPAPLLLFNWPIFLCLGLPSIIAEGLLCSWEVIFTQRFVLAVPTVA